MTLAEIIKTNLVTDKKFALLTNVSVDSGKAGQSNKFYSLFEQTDGTIKIIRGRIDSSFVVEPKTPPLYEWDKIIKSKTQRSKDAYTNITHLFTEAVTAQPTNPTTGAKTTIADIADKVVKKLFDELQAYANKSIAQNYTVEVKMVTQAMVDEAQKVVDSIATKIKINCNTKELNEELMKLFRVIPRKMANVKLHLFDDIKTKSDVDNAQNKIAEEQATLDVMAGQVAQLKAQNELSASSKDDKKAVKQTKNILEVMGLEIAPVTDPKIIAMIKDKMNDLKINGQQDNSKIFKQAFTVINKKTQARFDKYLATAQNKQCQLLWHGSRNANFIGILEQGLKIRPTGVSINGKAFGEGTYFACHSGKSLNYTDYRGSYRSYTGGNSSQAFLLLFNVNVGKQKVVHTSGNYTLAQCRKEGCDSIHAKPTAGSYIAYDEFITFNEDQYTVQYLIEVQ